MQMLTLQTPGPGAADKLGSALEVCQGHGQRPPAPVPASRDVSWAEGGLGGSVAVPGATARLAVLVGSPQHEEPWSHVPFLSVRAGLHGHPSQHPRGPAGHRAVPAPARPRAPTCTLSHRDRSARATPYPRLGPGSSPHSPVTAGTLLQRGVLVPTAPRLPTLRVSRHGPVAAWPCEPRWLPAPERARRELCFPVRPVSPVSVQCELPAKPGAEPLMSYLSPSPLPPAEASRALARRSLSCVPRLGFWRFSLK